MQGVSVSGMETCITLPQMGIALDIGMMTVDAVNCQTVLITHGHMDHIGAITMHAARRALLGMTPSVFIVPPGLAPSLQSLFKVWGALEGAKNGEQIPCTIVPLPPEVTYDLGKGLSVRPFITDHRIESQGYRIIETRKKLKAEYLGMPGDEIARLRSQGVEVSTVNPVTRLVYTGDTRVSVWDRVEDIRHAQVIITEATYSAGDRTPAHADERGHTHLQELVDRAEIFDTQALVLTHFSARYRESDIHEAINGAAWPDRIRPLVRII